MGVLGLGHAGQRGAAAARHSEAGETQGAFSARFARAIGAMRRFVASCRAVEGDHATAFNLLPVMLGAGAALYFTLAFEPGWPAVLLAAVLAGTFAAALYARHAPRAALLLLFVVGGMVLAKWQTWRVATPMLGATVTTTITGEVRSVEHRDGGRMRILLDVLDTARPQLRHGPGRIRVTSPAMDAPPRAGERLTGRVRLVPVQGPLRPGGYDFSYHGYFDGIGATGFFLGAPRRIAGPKPDLRPRDRIARLRHRIDARIARHLTGDTAGVAMALITGARSGISPQSMEALRLTGLAHILSISGLHMVLVAGSVLAMVRILFALSPVLAARLPVRKIAAAVALVVILFYLLLSGAAVATMRAWIMLSIMLVAVLCDRPSLTMRNVAIAALVLLALWPHEILDPGFQMSFAATAALIAGYRGWASWRAARDTGFRPAAAGVGAVARKGVRAIGGMAATSLLAGLATGLIGIWHFNRVAPLGFVANMAAGPIISFLVMPAGLAAALLMPFGLEGPALAVMASSIDWVLAIAGSLAAQSPPSATGQLAPWIFVCGCIALVVATVPASRLRLLAVPLVAIVLAGWTRQQLPSGLVSEDARLVAIRLADGGMAVNRKRSNPFLVRIWMATLAARKEVPPVEADGDKAEPEQGGPFRCRKGLCMARTGQGHLVAHAADIDAARRACAFRPDLLVIADATADPDLCDHAVVLTARALARRGSVAMIEDPSGGLSYDYVLEKALRPWHAQRIWSRAARGLPAWTKRDGKGAGDETRAARDRPAPRNQGPDGAAADQR